MIEPDTIRLLRECDAGLRMGDKSIDSILDRVEDPALARTLDTALQAHEAMREEVHDHLIRCHDKGKAPGRCAQIMSRIKCETCMAIHRSDATAAEIIIDGCHMGVKSLSRYLNQYQAADEVSKDLAKRLIRLEDQLAEDLRAYL